MVNFEQKATSPEDGTVVEEKKHASAEELEQIPDPDVSAKEVRSEAIEVGDEDVVGAATEDDFETKAYPGESVQAYDEALFFLWKNSDEVLDRFINNFNIEGTMLGLKSKEAIKAKIDEYGEAFEHKNDKDSISDKDKEAIYSKYNDAMLKGQFERKKPSEVTADLIADTIIEVISNFVNTT